MEVAAAVVEGSGQRVPTSTVGGNQKAWPEQEGASSCSEWCFGLALFITNGRRIGPKLMDVDCRILRARNGSGAILITGLLEHAEGEH